MDVGALLLCVHLCARVTSDASGRLRAIPARGVKGGARLDGRTQCEMELFMAFSSPIPRPVEGWAKLPGPGRPCFPQHRSRLRLSSSQKGMPSSPAAPRDASIEAEASNGRVPLALEPGQARGRDARHAGIHAHGRPSVSLGREQQAAATHS